VAKIGRPTRYSDEIADRICGSLVEGESLRSICTEMGFGLRMVFRWLEDHEYFKQQYARARQVQAEVWADEIVQISNKPNVGIRTKTTDRGTEVIEGDNVERSKLQVDARKWVAAKLLPKKYGDHTETTEYKDRLRELQKAKRLDENGAPGDGK